MQVVTQSAADQFSTKVKVPTAVPGTDPFATEAVKDKAATCVAGRYPEVIGEINVCAFCPAGTYGDGTAACTACVPGRALAIVGGTACGAEQACTGFTYSRTGYSHCLTADNGEAASCQSQHPSAVCQPLAGVFYSAQGLGQADSASQLVP